MNRSWENEPDRVEFKYKGFDCLIRRAAPKSQNPKDWLGNLCGYVAVTPDHPYYGKDYSEIDLHAHGGLTYSNACRGDICHKTDIEDKVWWFGFDCAHGGDLIPSIWEARQPGGYLHHIREDLVKSFGSSARDFIFQETYKTIEFVEDEIKSLVDQLEEVK